MGGATGPTGFSSPSSTSSLVKSLMQSSRLTSPWPFCSAVRRDTGQWGETAHTQNVAGHRGHPPWRWAETDPRTGRTQWSSIHTGSRSASSSAGPRRDLTETQAGQTYTRTHRHTVIIRRHTQIHSHMQAQTDTQMYTSL